MPYSNTLTAYQVPLMVLQWTRVTTSSSIIWREAKAKIPTVIEFQVNLLLDLRTLRAHHMLPRNHVLAARSNTNPADLHSNGFLDELNILSGIDGKIIEIFSPGSRYFPSRKRFIGDIHFVKCFWVCWKWFELLTLERVAGSYLDLLKIIQDVKFCKIERRIIVNVVWVFDDDKVEPSASPLATGGDADFLAHALKFVANFVQLLGWKWSTITISKYVIIARSVNSRKLTTQLWWYTEYI